MPDAKTDHNRQKTLIGVSSVDGRTPTLVEVDPVTGETLVQPPAATTPTVYNETLTVADTEYDVELPANTKELRFRCRTAFDVRFAWVTGKVAAPTAPYLTLPSGRDYSSDKNNFTGLTLYLASSEAGVVVEIEIFT